MRKWVFQPLVLRRFCSLFALVAASAYGQLSDAPLLRAQEDLTRIKELVEKGTLPKSMLDDAEARLADAQDEEILSHTLYDQQHSQTMSPQEQTDMVEAASRRMDRAQAKLDARQKLLDMGIISKQEMAGVRNDLNSRRLVLELAQNRVKMIQELQEMAAEEQRMQLPTMQNSMIRFDGNVAFKLADLPAIEKDFKARFHQDLPVSALGQTMLHQSMGLDHRNRVDVALNPDQPEGLWLRSYLENRHLSYLAFRCAVTGAATAPHIHIGTGSTRLLPALYGTARASKR